MNEITRALIDAANLLATSGGQDGFKEVAIRCYRIATMCSEAEASSWWDSRTKSDNSVPVHEVAVADQFIRTLLDSAPTRAQISLEKGTERNSADADYVWSLRMAPGSASDQGSCSIRARNLSSLIQLVPPV